MQTAILKYSLKHQKTISAFFFLWIWLECTMQTQKLVKVCVCHSIPYPKRKLETIKLISLAQYLI
nr:MAG TPA: hypothetical protein [Caudoviricetes sp.]